MSALMSAVSHPRGLPDLILPETLEAIRRQSGVAHRRGNRPVTEIMLDRASVLPVVGQLVPAAVAQHVAVNEKAELGGFTGTGDHPLIAGHAQRRQALRHEDMHPLRGLP